MITQGLGAFGCPHHYSYVCPKNHQICQLLRNKNNEKKNNNKCNDKCNEEGREREGRLVSWEKRGRLVVGRLNERAARFGGDASCHVDAKPAPPATPPPAALAASNTLSKLEPQTFEKSLSTSAFDGNCPNLR